MYVYYMFGAVAVVWVLCVLFYLWGWSVGKRHPDFEKVVEYLNSQLDIRRAEDRVLKQIIGKVEAIRAGSEPRK